MGLYETPRLGGWNDQLIEAIGASPLVIEEFLEGEEASLFALVDGETAVAFAGAAASALR